MKKITYHPLTIIIVTIVVSWLYASLLRTEEKMHQSTESVAVLDQEVEEIASQVSFLEKQLEIAQSDQAKEQRIRDELLLKKPGEYVVQLPAITASSEKLEEEDNISPWQSWKQLLSL